MKGDGEWWWYVVDRNFFLPVLSLMLKNMVFAQPLDGDYRGEKSSEWS